MISKLEHWLQDQIIEALRKQSPEEINLPTIIAEHDPEDSNSDYPTGSVWKNAITQKNWRLEKKWKTIPKTKKKTSS